MINQQVFTVDNILAMQLKYIQQCIISDRNFKGRINCYLSVFIYYNRFHHIIHQ